jgi:F420-dependent oxidoreductase-like protein
MDLAIMIEGQMGLNWSRWQRIVPVVEELGFAGLYRSDHFVNPQPPDQDSLELWVSLTWLADHTQRIDFGPLVAPLSFRHPAIMARMASAVDDLSGGRLQLGLGAGWQEREHHTYGFELLDWPARLKRFEEGVEVIVRLLRSDQPVSFNGVYYRLHDAVLLPRPQRPGGPPIVIGGGRSILSIAARYADEWNTIFAVPETFAALNRRLDELLERNGRQPHAVRRSVMTGLVFGRTETEIRRRAELYGRPAEELRSRGFVVGHGDDIVEQLGALAEAGAQRVMLQWLALDDLDGLAAFAQTVLPHFGTIGHSLTPSTFAPHRDV